MILDLALARLDLGGIHVEQKRLAEAGELADQAASTFADMTTARRPPDRIQNPPVSRP